MVEHWPSSQELRWRQARLTNDRGHSLHDVLPPLIEPERAALKDNRMVLLGYEVHVDPENGAVEKLPQGWVVNLAIAFMQPNAI